jgi:flavodoxin I
MNILIAYFSQTGNTDQIARAIQAEISSRHNTTVAKNEALNTASCSDFDLVFIGSPCHAGTLSAPMRNFLSSLPENPAFHLAGFITHASAAYSKSDYELCMIYLNSLCTQKGITYHGCYECQGRLAPQLHEFIKKSKKISDEEWAHMITEMNGHPDREDEKKAREFARDVILKTGI